MSILVYKEKAGGVLQMQSLPAYKETGDLQTKALMLFSRFLTVIPDLFCAFLWDLIVSRYTTLILSPS